MTIRTTPASKAAAMKALGDEDKAVVVEEKHSTTTYTKPAPKTDEKDNQENQAKSDSKGNTDLNQGNSFVLKNKATLPENKIAVLFQDLKDIEDEENEIFYALITRRQDLMNDNFRRQCLSNETFPAMQISSNGMFQFIPMIQKYNGNSGGRFDIVICDRSGEALEDIGLSGFAIANPIVEDIQQSNNQNGNQQNLDVVTLLKEMNEASDKRFAQMLQAMQPKEDEFTSIAKEKLRQDILNPQRNAQQVFDPSQTIQNVMQSMAVTEAMAKGFAGMFNKNDTGEKDRGLLESLLTNEMFMDKASGMFEHTTNVLADLVENIKGAQVQAPPQYVNPNEYEQAEPYPPLQAQPTNEEQNQMNEEQQKLINDVIAEIESDRPLNDTNKFLLDLKENHKDHYATLAILCKVVPFEQVLAQLRAVVPETFDEYFNEDGTPSEKGTNVAPRLKEFYDFMHNLQE